MSEDGLKELLGYIEQREESLSRYSDKLRESLKKIDNMFGDSKYCAICSGREEAREHHRFYSRKESKGLDDVEEIIDNAVRIIGPNDFLGHWANAESGEVYVEDHEKAAHQFKACIEVSVNVWDTEPFKTEETEMGTYEAYLAIIEHDLGIARKDRDHKGTLLYETNHRVQLFSEASRQTLKDIIHSNRLIPFLRHVADVLEKKNREYKEVSEVAKKLTSAL